MSAKSRFVWHDLNTRDVSGAKRFYGEMFNWRFEGKPGDSYEHIRAGDRMIGGIRAMGAHEPMPPSWLAYVAVDDVATTVAKMESLGGKVHVKATAMPDVGTFAVVGDPTGAVLAPWKSARPDEDQEPAGLPGVYRFCWDELLTSNAAAAAPFYTGALGWGIETVDMGPMGTYTLFKRTGIKDEMGADKNAGGMMQSPPDAPHPPFWLAYIAVPNADEGAEKARRLGATVMVPPADIPDVGRFSVMMDAQGAAFAILQPKR
jgi:predicted enzyme related to lactoylglutathione lyase